MTNITAMSTEALLFRQTFNRVSTGTPYACKIAWQLGTCIQATVRKTEGMLLTEKTFTLSVANDYEVATKWILAEFDMKGADE